MDWAFLLSQITTYVPYLVGLVFPFLITVLNTRFTGSKAHFMVTLVTCLIGATLLKIGEIVGSSWESVPAVLSLFTVIITEATAVYHLFYDGTKAETQMKSLANVVMMIKK